jgi:flagellar motility protein MotE (MotC chaperone)
MLRLFQSSWFAALLGSLAYLTTTAALLHLPPSDFAHTGRSEAKRSPNNDPSWKFRNPEFDQWVSELNAEKEALAGREQQLKEWQTRLEAERSELATVTQAVAQLQAEFDRNVVRFKEQEEENLRRQVKLLGAMPTETQVKMLTPLADEEFARLLILMKNEQASLLLDTLSKTGKEEAKRAATLMDLMRRSVTPTAQGRRKKEE